ncbi:T3SS effector protein NleE, partial [Escherichia coli]|nr:T3SS effector protein NleE [Escherichia coli]EFA8906795.1 T3SS effector protein NleE [Escherichia coli O157:H7]EES1939170.1 T3SS effector protein NleE [Escherichia coli]EES5862636.1 T3SS effector protein NleE [Escherichia coli]EEU1913835.1 T3SS effector protein NleE [Escherichia coli]
IFSYMPGEIDSYMKYINNKLSKIE